MTARATLLGASFVLAHVPDLVRYGSKPTRETARLDALLASLRTYHDAVEYPPAQVFLGNLRPAALWDVPRPHWRQPVEGAMATGPSGELLPQARYYDLLSEVDSFGIVRLDAKPEAPGEIALYEHGEVVGAVRPDHDLDDALSAPVLLENLSCKASAVQAVRHLLASTGSDPGSIGHAIGCGEEAVGDRYQRGGGNLAKAVAEHCGLQRASGIDVKAFCAGPVHALAVAAALVEAGIEERVVVLAGGSLAKLGMKFEGALTHAVPILEDVLAGMAVLLGPGDGPTIRTDAIGRHPVGAGSSQRALFEALVGGPLDAMGRRLTDIDVYATEVHDPEITEPAGAGDVPERNYRMLAGLGVLRGDVPREEIEGFARTHGMPGFAPTQGHIASAVPWLPHALASMARGEIRTTMLVAKGSLFLGRLTRAWDGASVTLEA
jgi:hypothetical protein